MKTKLIGNLTLGSEQAAGYDLTAVHGTYIYPGARKLIDTGVRLEMPDGMCALVVPRSGLAWKNGITVLNAPGLVDPDYRGEIKVNLFNAGDKTVDIEPGMRIAQLLFVPFIRPEFVSEELGETARGAGGHGSTGA